MTNKKKFLLAEMLAHICRKDMQEAACPWHIIDPYGLTLCPMGEAERCFTPPCKSATRQHWLDWMEKKEAEDDA